MRYLIVVLVQAGLTGCEHQKNDSKTDSLITQQGSNQYYSEKYRPQFHFSPPANWMNDPNGMVYHNGEYHLFYQYYPDSTVWGPMHWGHAVSEDLVHWENLPIAIYPDTLGYIFSGSAVFDVNNTSGLGTIDNPPLVAIYTYHDAEEAGKGSITYQTQAIAFSLDNGRSWTKYNDNPVLENPGIIDFRDPKVRWHNESAKWIMSLAVKDHIRFYSSDNLIDWKAESEFGKHNGSHEGVWECPDLFPLELNGKEKWVLFVSINPGAPWGGSGTQYFIGDFDGSVFSTNQTDTLWLDYGRDNYAGVTWANNPDNRTIFIGWMSNWLYAQKVPTHPWRGAMTLPRSLELFEEKDLIKIKSVPVKELIRLRSDSVDLIPALDDSEIYAEEISQGVLVFEISGEEYFEGKIKFSNDVGEEIIIEIKGVEGMISFDRSNMKPQHFNSDFLTRYKTDLPDNLKIDLLKIFKDESSIELFINDGEYVFTELYFSDQPLNKLIVDVRKGKVESAMFFPFVSVWR